MDRFVEEIEFTELRFLEIVGRGAFGVVRSAIWKGINVAVKHIETEAEKKAFATELTQLSRVNHPNIVKLYGACTKNPVCLVMEYAEGGSLYNVLHSSDQQPQYYLAHAISWCLQCAQGVDYLHSMKPKPLIHRDLKPPNLLLVQGATVLKICDFGTACDQHTYMTNNKGSAAWMAPEVFEGSSYSEKCDVFSWGIILWEVLTRRKPFEELGGPAFRIMWAVHNGTRPPLITNCPKVLELIMTKCWATNPMERPSMSEVVRVMTCFSKHLKGADVPLPCSATCASPASQSAYPTVQDARQSAYPTVQDAPSGYETMRQTISPFNIMTHETKQLPNIQALLPPQSRQISAPPSLAASWDNLLDRSSRSSTPSEVHNKRYSADLSNLEEVDVASMAHVKGHRRTGSHGSAPFNQLPTVSDEDKTAVIPGLGDQVKTSPTNLNKPVAYTADLGARSVSWAPRDGAVPRATQLLPTSENIALDFAYSALDHQLQPLAPCPTCQESLDIYDQHVKLAEEYREVQMDIYLLTQKRRELDSELQKDQAECASSARNYQEYFDLQSEQDSLKLLYQNLKTQVSYLRQPPTTTSNI